MTQHTYKMGVGFSQWKLFFELQMAAPMEEAIFETSVQSSATNQISLRRLRGASLNAAQLLG